MALQEDKISMPAKLFCMDYGLLENWIREQWLMADLSNIEVAENNHEF